MLELGELAGFRIEGRDRARYMDLDGEGSENDRMLFTVQEASPTLRGQHEHDQDLG